MKFYSCIVRTILCGLLYLILFSCQKTRPVVPFETDTDEICRPLSPNDDSNPMELTFGHENVSGFVFDIDMMSKYQDVYVFFQNFTILDVNPSITQDLFEFIQQQLCEYGFINDSVNLEPDEIKKLIDSGLSYKEAAGKILDIQNREFESQIDNNPTPVSPMNIYFMIYPVYLDSNYVTYWQSSYSYTGGAHGMTVSFMKTYDLNTGKPVTLNDIIKSDRINEIREEVAAHMAYSYPIYENITTVDQYLDSLNMWLDNFSPDDSSNKISAKNFPLSDPAITKEGLVFVYQMYELTPGSDGCPIVLIPYNDIKSCLSISL